MMPRIYRDSSDLQKMCALLQAGCADRATNAYYPHPGDLNWWLFNWLDGQNPWQSIYLWDNPDNHERLFTWGIYFPWGDFNVFVQPQFSGTEWAVEIDTWMEEKSIGLAHQQGHAYLQRANVAETDEHLCVHLSRRGFQHVPPRSMLLCSQIHPGKIISRSIVTLLHHRGIQKPVIGR